MHASFCVKALDEALAKRDAPEIMNRDQGSQFTSADWITTLTKFQDGFQARQVIEDWITFYNTKRPRSALEHRTPGEANWGGKPETQARLNLNRIHPELWRLVQVPEPISFAAQLIVHRFFTLARRIAKGPCYSTESSVRI